MPSLGQLFKKYTGSIRSFKLVYVINNLLNKKKLKHNKALYQKYGVNQSIYSSIDSSTFSVPNNDIPWIDKPDALDKIMEHPEFSSFDEPTQKQIIHFVHNGYMVLKGFYSQEEVDALNNEVDNLLKSDKTDFNYTGRKIPDAHKISEVIDKNYFRNKKKIKLLEFLLGRPVIPFQTLNFIEGSEQRPHSDSIHMTTEPKGYMIATWAALEKCHEGNGPLVYYPGSHRLPYVTTEDYDSGKSKWVIGNSSNKKYEEKIAELIQEQNLEKKYNYCEAGDLFIWHANLLHGGSPITQKGTTRRSMVAHYYGEGVICYHEISQRPALIDPT